jgi:hypothetical protein
MKNFAIALLLLGLTATPADVNAVSLKTISYYPREYALA